MKKDGEIEKIIAILEITEKVIIVAVTKK